MNKKNPEKHHESDNAGTVREDPLLRPPSSFIRNSPPPASAITHSPSAEVHPQSAIRHLLDFEDMQVWQDAQDLAVAIYQDMGIVKDFSFVDQIKRAAVSISNNIAEGAERVTPSEFARFLDIAKGSVGEVRSMYRLACR
ncbi:MAG: four helix bundle protein, partial [Verrucomicrobiota bacterium]